MTRHDPSSQPVLAIEEVWAGYAGVDALRGVTLHARGGTVTGVIGANGAGKSTLLRVMLGTLAPRTGRALLHGRDVARVPVGERARSVAYISQKPGVAFAFTSSEVVELGCPWLGGVKAREAARTALDRVGLADRADVPLGTLSVGQQQRVSVARAWAQVMTSPHTRSTMAVLADEPVASMDPAHAIQTLDLLRTLAAEGVCVVIVLHDLLLASKFTDALLLLRSNGTPAALGPTREVLTASNLEGVFATPFRDVGNGIIMPERLAAR